MLGLSTNIASIRRYRLNFKLIILYKLRLESNSVGYI